MFKYIRNKDDFDYYLFKEKLSNNQTLEMKFWDEGDIIYIETRVYSKRKHNITEHESTGKVGLESLLLAKLAVKLFIDFMIEEKMNKKIVVAWSDNRRRKIYYRGLKNLGFEYEYLYCNDGTSTKFLTRNINNEKRN
jgi:hypothetical protein